MKQRSISTEFIKTVKEYKNIAKVFRSMEDRTHGVWRISNVTTIVGDNGMVKEKTVTTDKTYYTVVLGLMRKVRVGGLEQRVKSLRELSAQVAADNTAGLAKHRYLIQARTQITSVQALFERSMRYMTAIICVIYAGRLNSKLSCSFVSLIETLEALVQILKPAQTKSLIDPIVSLLSEVVSKQNTNKQGVEQITTHKASITSEVSTTANGALICTNSSPVDNPKKNNYQETGTSTTRQLCLHNRPIHNNPKDLIIVHCI